MPVSMQSVFRHITSFPPAVPTLREMVEIPQKGIRLQVRSFPFSIMTYNTALLPKAGGFDVFYKGSDRAGAVAEFISRIRSSPPDVAGLCEMFDNDEREQVWTALSGIYRGFRQGPDESNILDPDHFREDGGLLLLSRFPINPLSGSLLYEGSTGNDRLANKGVLHITVRHPAAEVDVDIFFTHTQDMSAPGDAVHILYSQLSQLGGWAGRVSNPLNPAFIMGDLNIPGNEPVHFREMINRLNGPADLWLATGNAPAIGFTSVTTNNFGNPSGKDERLDFILMKHGTRLIPICKSMQLLKWDRNGRQISDHFGLLARFELLVEVVS